MPGVTKQHTLLLSTALFDALVRIAEVRGVSTLDMIRQCLCLRVLVHQATATGTQLLLRQGATEREVIFL